MKRVDPKVYSKEYYLSDCSGYEEFKKGILDRKLKTLIKHIPFKKGSKILDVGCGRGELVLYYAKRGASESIGVDYSEDAIDLARKRLKEQTTSIRKIIRYDLMDAKHIEFKDDYFDIVIMTEVFEHLNSVEQNEVLMEIKRVLKRKGWFVIHTEPNRIFNDMTYRYWSYPISTLLVAINNLLFSKDYPNLPYGVNIRKNSHKIMHINEPSYFDLAKVIKKHNFKGSIRSTNTSWSKPILSWKDRIYNFICFIDPISRYLPFNILFGQDFFAVLRKI
jgi:ubiquinone/menaquinone biosynthesis C-methylase UbiE